MNYRIFRIVAIFGKYSLDEVQGHLSSGSPKKTEWGLLGAVTILNTTKDTFQSGKTMLI